MFKKKMLAIILVTILILTVTSIFIKKEPKDITMKEADIYFFETMGGDNGLYLSLDILRKIEQEKTKAEVYIFENEKNDRTSIYVKNKENVELVKLKLIGDTIHIEIKKSRIKENIIGDKIGKVIQISTQKQYENVIVTKKKGLFK
jgi:hypothetical protein